MCTHRTALRPRGRSLHTRGRWLPGLDSCDACQRWPLPQDAAPVLRGLPSAGLGVCRSCSTEICSSKNVH